MNERLRTVMLQRGVAPEDLAVACKVDPKTVTRWITPGRVPHRTHRWKTAKILDVDEVYLWPNVLDNNQARQREATQSELIQVYPDRSSVSRDSWLRFLGEARELIDVLVFSGTFFAQTNPRVATMLAERAAAGVQVRLCFGSRKQRRRYPGPGGGPSRHARREDPGVADVLSRPGRGRGMQGTPPPSDVVRLTVPL